jgi:dihydropteroate synthase
VHFLIKEINQEFAKKSIQEVGFDSSYIEKVLEKYKFKLLKIFDLTPQQASILKQSALSVGADCAVHREVITCKIEKTDAILGGSYEQLKKIAQKLKQQPFSLNKLADCLVSNLENELEPIVIGKKNFDWSKTYLMGILNITPDSFSDGGKYFTLDEAVYKAREMALHCEILDIGGESTRPNAKKVDIDEEIKRICPVITSIRDKGVDIPISIDTRNAKTAKQAILAGADIVNDVSGGAWDVEMLDVVSEFQAPFILMHSIKTPGDMQENPSYDKVVDEIYLDLSQKTGNAISRGVKKDKIIIDIGIGFGKNLEHNLELLKRISEFKSLGFPMLIGISRKSFMKEIEPLDFEETDIATLSVNSYLASEGVNILRVHNPKLHKKSLMIIDRL